jgi:hypothetical protein
MVRRNPPLPVVFREHHEKTAVGHDAQHLEAKSSGRTGDFFGLPLLGYDIQGTFPTRL